MEAKLFGIVGTVWKNKQMRSRGSEKRLTCEDKVTEEGKKTASIWWRW